MILPLGKNCQNIGVRLRIGNIMKESDLLMKGHRMLLMFLTGYLNQAASVWQILTEVAMCRREQNACGHKLATGCSLPVSERKYGSIIGVISLYLQMVLH